jgi:small-conductance mechanosensitive channel
VEGIGAHRYHSLRKVPMREQFGIILQTLRGLVVSLAALGATVLFGYILRRILFRKLAQWSKKTTTQIDDIVISSVRGPFIVWFLILGLYLGLELSKYPDRVVHVIQKILMVLAIFSVTFALANIASRLVRAYSAKVDTTLPVTSVTQHVSRLIIFSIGLLIILSALGISITPMLATLGVGGLAVALALQDTLANLFAGIQTTVAKQIRVGDFVKLDSGEEGYVTDINWRTTKIRMLPNNIVLVPNEKLAKAIVTNYYLPEKNMAVLVDVGVHYGSDLRKVEQVTCEVGREVMREVPGGVSDFEPFIRYHTFGDSSIDFTVILRANEVVDRYIIKHEFIKRLHERYAREGIVIPFPIRAINYDQEKR